jgi:DNA-binding MarR family transcriptional regulator
MQSASAQLLEDLLDEVRLAWHVLIQVGESIHASEPITLGMRSVLELLLKHGPKTVPDIARSRFVTRQHIQMLVNGLLDVRLVTLSDNPAHKRSSLVCLSRSGERTIQRMLERERGYLARGESTISAPELRRAAATLRSVRDLFATRTT